MATGTLRIGSGGAFAVVHMVVADPPALEIVAGCRITEPSGNVSGTVMRRGPGGPPGREEGMESVELLDVDEDTSEKGKCPPSDSERAGSPRVGPRAPMCCGQGGIWWPRLRLGGLGVARPSGATTRTTGAPGAGELTKGAAPEGTG
jgi:hypothetical protein